MRRDEMYIAQRDSDGKSELVGLSEFEGVRYDKDLIRSYLDGRFGGIPMLREEVSRGKVEEQYVSLGWRVCRSGLSE